MEGGKFFGDCELLVKFSKRMEGRVSVELLDGLKFVDVGYVGVIWKEGVDVLEEISFWFSVF